MRKFLLSIFTLTFAAATLPQTALAHCPLCTAGAGALAVFAASMGVPTSVVGVFVGAFALALGLWVSRMIKKKHIVHQNILLVAVIFLTTIIPILSFADEYRSFSIFIYGDYGSLLNRTYLINNFLLGAIVGGVLLLAAPWVSRKFTEARQGKKLPYQGLGVTFGLLIVAALLFQFAI